jgi:hypothetical protein
MWAYAPVSSVSNPGTIREIWRHEKCITKTARSQQVFSVDLIMRNAYSPYELQVADD